MYEFISIHLLDDTLYLALHSICIGDDRPFTKDLHNHVVQGAARNWKDLGIQLLDPSISDRVLDIIEIDHPQDSTTCCKCMLRKWLDTKLDASWSQLLNALRSPCVQLNHLADQIKQKLDEKRKILQCITLVFMGHM